MICKKCGIKLKCVDTFCQNNETYRRYTCPICGKKDYTQELRCNKALANRHFVIKQTLNKKEV